MDLIITRPALDNALKEMNFDLEKPTRQQMRSLVCAKCHMEYYFKGDRAYPSGLASIKCLILNGSSGYSN